jgi:hypothetical protein
LITHLKKYYLLLCLLLIVGKTIGQLTVSGTVFDSSKTIPVKDVLIKSTIGTHTKTDSLGKYEIVVNDNDSITFIYHNKATAGFAVNQIPDIGNFNISLRVRVYEKFKTLKEVRIYSNTYRQDSMENRIDNADVFNYQKPGIGTTSSSYSGAAGLDLDEFINIFRFKRNRQLRSLQNRLVEDEQEKYIDYRFNKRLVKRITRLDSTQLDTFMIIYRPDYEFTQRATTAEFYQYILNASYQFKSELLMQKKKE